MTRVKFFRLSDEAIIPTRAKEDDACYDVYIISDITLGPGETKLIPLGFKVAIPKGWEMQVRSRSGLVLKSHIMVANAPGTIDSGYRGEVCVILYNFNNWTATFEKGTKIAQVCLKRVYDIEFEEVDSEEALGLTDRGVGGFGSTDETILSMAEDLGPGTEELSNEVDDTLYGDG